MNIKFPMLPVLLAMACCIANAAENAPLNPGAVTEMKITQEQLIEFENGGVITLLDSQKALLEKNAGVAPSSLELWYTQPGGENILSARNVAVKVSKYDIRVLHRFLQKDDPAFIAARKKQKAENAARSQNDPRFYIDADGVIWSRCTRQDFEKYMAVHKAEKPQSFVQIYLGPLPAGAAPETVAAIDEARRLQRITKKAGMPSMVMLKDGKAVQDIDVRRPATGFTKLLPNEVPDAEKRLRAIGEFFCKQAIAGTVKDLAATQEVPDVWGDALGAGWSLPDTLAAMSDDLRDGYTIRVNFGDLDEAGEKIDRLKPKPGERDLSPGRDVTHSIIILTKKGGVALRMCYVDGVKKFMITSYLPLKAAVKETPQPAGDGKLPE